MLIQSQQTCLLLLKGLLDNNKLIYCYPNNIKPVIKPMFASAYSDFRGIS